MLHIACNLNDDNESVVSQRGHSLFTLLLFLQHIWLHSRGSSTMLMSGFSQYFPWQKVRSTPTGKGDGGSCLAWPWNHQYEDINLINIANLHYSINIYVRKQWPNTIYIHLKKKIHTGSEMLLPQHHLCSWKAPDMLILVILGFLRGCHRNSDSSSELPCVDGSHRLKDTKFSERVIWNWDGNRAPGRETKGQ